MKHLTARPDVSMLPEPYQTIVAKALAKDPNHRPEPGLRPAAARGRAADARGPDHRRGQGEPLAPGPRPTTGRHRPAQEDILRIEAEEPVFYIGPDTPPRRPPARNVIGRANSGQLGGTTASSDRTCRITAPAAKPGELRRAAPPNANAVRQACVCCPADSRNRLRGGWRLRRRSRPRWRAAGSEPPNWLPRCSGPLRSWRS